MSDWTDLQLAHSLAPEKAPDELWARVQGGAVAARPSRPFRWAFPVGVAACGLVLLARLAAFELRTPRADFSPVETVAVERWAAHQAGSGRAWAAEGMRSKDMAATTNCGYCHTL
jgi:hypothetical protein